jgi:hypothetical protein
LNAYSNSQIQHVTYLIIFHHIYLIESNLITLYDELISIINKMYTYMSII